jgi:hypothetical protein
MRHPPELLGFVVIACPYPFCELFVRTGPGGIFLHTGCPDYIGFIRFPQAIG